MDSLLNWLKGALSEKDGTPSSKRLLYAAAVFAALGFVGWDTHLHHGLTLQGVAVLQLTVGSTAAAYIGGRIAEAKEATS